MVPPERGREGVIAMGTTALDRGDPPPPASPTRRFRNARTIEGRRPHAAGGTGPQRLVAQRPLSIVLVRPAAVLPLDASHALYELPPLGVAYLASSLEKAGHHVRIVDAFGEAPDQTERHAEGYATRGLTAEQIIERMPRDVDLIGVSCMFSSSWLHCRKVIAHLAREFPHVPLIVGGEHPTADYDRLLRRVPEVSCCVLGEGEETIVDIAAHLSHGLPLDDVPGIARRDAPGRIVTTPERPRIREVDDIPWPSWTTVPVNNYLAHRFSHDCYFEPTMPLLG